MTSVQGPSLVLGLQTKPKELVCKGFSFLFLFWLGMPAAPWGGLCGVLRVESLPLARRNSHVSIRSCGRRSAQPSKVAGENWTNPHGYLSVPA